MAMIKYFSAAVLLSLLIVDAAGSAPVKVKQGMIRRDERDREGAAAFTEQSEAIGVEGDTTQPTSPAAREIHLLQVTPQGDTGRLYNAQGDTPIPCTTDQVWKGSPNKRVDSPSETFTSCQQLCVPPSCTGFNYWPSGGKCRTITGPYDDFKTVGWTVVGGASDCTWAAPTSAPP